jgi:hypothetical protein
MKRILLDDEDFKKLTKGEVIKKDDVEIALSDIGYYYMTEIIRNNWKGSN